MNEPILFIAPPKRATTRKRNKKRPIRNFSAYLTSLFKEYGELELIEQVTLSVQNKIFKVTCHDDETYQKLKLYEPKISSEILQTCGMKGIIFQYDVYYAVLKVLRDFERQGVTEFTVAQVGSEVNKLPPQRAETRIKAVLYEFGQDLSDQWRYSSQLPQWLLQLRGAKPLVKYLGRNVFGLIPKPPPQPKKEKKSGKAR